MKLKDLKERFQKMETANQVILITGLISFIVTVLIKISGLSLLTGAPVLIDGLFVFMCVATATVFVIIIVMVKHRPCLLARPE